MQELPLPLFKGTQISIQPNSKQIIYNTGKVEFYSISIRNKLRNSCKISTYLPVNHFKNLDNWLTNWDGLPFLWQNKVWVCLRYEVNYLNSGKSGNITLELLDISN